MCLNEVNIEESGNEVICYKKINADITAFYLISILFLFIIISEYSSLDISLLLYVR